MVKQLQNIIFFLILGCCGKIMAQPTVLGTDVANYPTYTTNAFNNFGKLKQFRVQVAANAASGQVKWEFVTGTVGTPNYSTNWRPYIGGLTLFSFDSIIAPHSPLATAYASAQLNTSFGGIGGFLPSVAKVNNYTFNINNNTGNNYMAVWETTFNPTIISVVTQNPTIVCAGGDSVTTNVTSNQVLNIAENSFLRYSLTNNFTLSTLMQFTFNGTNGNVKIPIPSAPNSIYFHVFTSKYNLAKLAPIGIFNERYSDLSTLSINNNSNNNYSFTVISANLPSPAFSSINYCVGLPTTFNNTSTISSGSISSYLWSLGNGNISTYSESSFSKTSNTIGTYFVSLTATSDLGFQKTSNQSITIDSLAAANSINAN